jgi:hypothetical protein
MVYTFRAIGEGHRLTCIVLATTPDLKARGGDATFCGQTIQRAADGLVQWLTVPGTMKSLELRLIHATAASPHRLADGCRLDAAHVLETYLLTDLLGPEGLQQLFKFAAEGELPLDEVLEMVKRLHTPDYERLEHIISEDML